MTLTYIDSIDIYWDILRYIEIYWDILTYIDIYWHILTYIDIYWPILTYIDIYWHILTYINIYWHIDLRTNPCGLRKGSCWLWEWTNGMPGGEQCRTTMRSIAGRQMANLVHYESQVRSSQLKTPAAERESQDITMSASLGVSRTLLRSAGYLWGVSWGQPTRFLASGAVGHLHAPYIHWK